MPQFVYLYLWILPVSWSSFSASTLSLHDVKEQLQTILYMLDGNLASTKIIAASQGGFIAPHVWEIVRRKNLTIFKMLPLFAILYKDFLNFSENRGKELKLGPMYFNILIFLPLGTNH